MIAMQFIDWKRNLAVVAAQSVVGFETRPLKLLHDGIVSSVFVETVDEIPGDDYLLNLIPFH